VFAARLRRKTCAAAQFVRSWRLTARFPTNWELLDGRALRVMHFLKERGVPAAALSAAGYADVDPAGPNDTIEGRKQNRRREITLQPDIDDFAPLP
jgi:chemotaxis protein MotB